METNKEMSDRVIVPETGLLQLATCNLQWVSEIIVDIDTMMLRGNLLQQTRYKTSLRVRLVQSPALLAHPVIRCSKSIPSLASC